MESNGHSRKRPRTEWSESTRVKTIKRVSNNMTKKQKDDMDRALHDKRILHKIVNNLDSPDLKNCRRVNSFWNKILSKRIMDHNCFAVRLHRQQDKNKRTSQRNLEELMKLLDSSTTTTSFPCSHFIFEDFVQIEPEVETFFKTHESKIVTLELIGSSGSSVENIFALLPSWFCDFYWPPHEEKFVLSSLKKFSWTGCPLPVSQILRSAPNLEDIPLIEMDPVNLKILGMTGKASLVKNLNCNGVDEEELSTFESMCPQLKSMTTSLITDDELEAVQKLIESCKDTLESLVVSNSSSGEIIFPQMGKLSTLKIQEWVDGHQLLFQSKISCEQKFPRLHILDCKGLTQLHEDDGWDKIFPSTDDSPGILSTVKTIGIDLACTELNMTRLTTLCPNFHTALTVVCDLTGSKALSKIFSLWTFLKGLEIRIENVGQCKLYFLDLVLTGMDKETCDRLRFVHYSRGRVEYFEGFVNGSNITHLKELKNLKIVAEPWIFLPISRLSGLYGFKFIPDLKVVFQGKFREHETQSIIEELGLYVNIQHSSRVTLLQRGE